MLQARHLWYQFLSQEVVIFIESRDLIGGIQTGPLLLVLVWEWNEFGVDAGLGWPAVAVVCIVRHAVSLHASLAAAWPTPLLPVADSSRAAFSSPVYADCPVALLWTQWLLAYRVSCPASKRVCIRAGNVGTGILLFLLPWLSSGEHCTLSVVRLQGGPLSPLWNVYGAGGLDKVSLDPTIKITSGDLETGNGRASSGTLLLPYVHIKNTFYWNA